MNGSLPAGWAEATLSDLGTWVGGGTPSKGRPEYWTNGTIPWVSPKDMKVHVVRQSEDAITDLALSSASVSLIPHPAVLVVVRSGILKHTLPVATSGVDVALNQDLKALVPVDGINPKYVAWALRRYESEILHSCAKTGTTVQSVEFPRFKNWCIPVAPTREQQRIVDALEEHLSRLDTIVLGLERLRAHAPRYRAAVLKAACEGSLTIAADVNYADEARTPPLRRLGDFLERIEAGKSFKCTERPPTLDQVGVLKVSAVTWGEFDEEESKTVTDPHRVDESYFVRPGDLLFSRANTIQLVGACVIVRSVRRRLMLSDKILRLVVKGIRPDWILLCLRSYQGRREIERLATGNQESMRNIGQDRIREIRIPVPPPALIDELLLETSRRMSLVDTVDATISTSLTRAQSLRHSILRRAFDGKLVPQDPSDEPAEALFDRIRSQTTADVPTVKSSRRSTAVT